VTPVFADTFYWIALINPRDGLHRRVLEATDELADRAIVTTDEVLTEVLAFCASGRQLRGEAALAVADILSDSGVRVFPQTRASFLGGFDLYRSRPDKGYSLTDCISMVTMRGEGLTDVLTNDRHFEQEGFHPLFHVGE
jgi:predicted nucleic acid-binding protein